MTIEAEISSGSEPAASQVRQTSAEFVVPGMHCAGCIGKIEKQLSALPGIDAVRANLSTKRVSVSWTDLSRDRDNLVGEFSKIGFEAVPFKADVLATGDRETERELLRALAVAGFAAANVMLLSVAVWAGLASDMDGITRELFHWVSALIALPTVAYSGRPFFKSALKVLRAGQINMDVPISLAVLLAAAMSLFETIAGAEHVYFDACVSLLFFLLIGRFLDARARSRVYAVAQNLLALRATSALVIEADGSRRTVDISELEPGMVVSVPTGMRVPADGEVLDGTTEIDKSLITGETLPEEVGIGDAVFAGTLNLGAPVTVRVSRRDEESLLAEIVRLMETAEQGRAKYVRLADRLARWYAPGVHILAGATFVGWYVVTGNVHASIMTAIAVLIVTCPCALGLAVPVVQVVASGRLLQFGILAKTADGLERLAEIDEVIFDKTGTLTLGRPELTNIEEIDPHILSLAGATASNSRHPLSQAVVRALADSPLPIVTDVEEVPGCGIVGNYGVDKVYLGKQDWVFEAVGTEIGAAEINTSGPQLWFARGEQKPICFTFEDKLKADAKEIVAGLKKRSFPTSLLSGDREEVVSDIAGELGLTSYSAAQMPQEKIAAINERKKSGAKVLMVGDGLNDAPALQASFVSMSPAEASDIAQTAADFVIQGNDLSPIIEAIDTARKARTLVIQNFGLAFCYNAIAIPLAIAGVITPLIAAIAMSSSSILVTVNSMRLAVRKAKGAAV